MLYLLLLILACMLLCLAMSSAHLTTSFDSPHQARGLTGKTFRHKAPHVLPRSKRPPGPQAGPSPQPRFADVLAPEVTQGSTPSRHQITQSGTSDSPPIPSLQVFSISAPPLSPRPHNGNPRPGADQTADYAVKPMPLLVHSLLGSTCR
jgi:hypothetical protein